MLLVAPPAQAWGAGFSSWWNAHGPATLSAIGCFLDGAALAGLFLGGVSGVGGVLAAAALIHGGLHCLG